MVNQRAITSSLDIIAYHRVNGIAITFIHQQLIQQATDIGDEKQQEPSIGWVKPSTDYHFLPNQYAAQKSHMSAIRERGIGYHLY